MEITKIKMTTMVIATVGMMLLGVVVVTAPTALPLPTFTQIED